MNSVPIISHLTLCSVDFLFFLGADFLSLYEETLLHPLLVVILISLPLSFSSNLNSALYLVIFSSSPTAICLLYPTLLKLFPPNVSSDLINAKPNTFMPLLHFSTLQKPSSGLPWWRSG